MRLIKPMIVSFLISLISSSTILADKNIWSIQIDLEKKEYVLYERIWLDVELTNPTSDTLYTYGIAYPNYFDFKIIIKNNSCEILDYTGPVYSFMTSGKNHFSPGETYYNSYNLLELYGDVDSPREYNAPWGFFNYLPEGNYSVQVKFENNISNVITFRIDVPVGEELEVLRLIDEASKNPMTKETRPEAVLIFHQILDNYPNSSHTQFSTWFCLRNTKESIEAVTNGTFDFNKLYF